MNIGSLHIVKKWFWLLFPTKETVVHVDAPFAIDDAEAAVASAYYSKSYNCEVTYFSPDSTVVFLEEDGKFKRVLTSDGKIGWIWVHENYNDCFEEVKTE